MFSVLYCIKDQTWDPLKSLVGQKQSFTFSHIGMYPQIGYHFPLFDYFSQIFFYHIINPKALSIKSILFSKKNSSIHTIHKIKLHTYCGCRYRFSH